MVAQRFGQVALAPLDGASIGDHECGDHASGDSQITSLNTGNNSNQVSVRNLFLILFYKTNGTSTDEVLELENTHM